MTNNLSGGLNVTNNGAKTAIVNN